jgi:L-alanine-DL-glutamate epimerase-like enolase superfamily enzyme
MRITAVDTFPVALPLSKPIQMSHVTIAQSNNVLVKITTDEGIVGWGEGVEAMDVTGENQGRIRAALEYFGALLIGADPLKRNDLWIRLRRSVAGNTTAIGAIDIALHDIAGKAYGVPVAELIGGAGRARIPALTLMGSGDPDQDLATYEAKYATGFRWFKVGIGDPDDEVKTITALSASAPDTVICGDANGAWSEQESLHFLRAIDGLRVRFIEQPTLNRDALIRLSTSSPIPLCADESARSLEDLVAIGRTAIAGVSLKLIKHGGITGVMRGATLCDTLGLAINLAGKIAESSIAAAANVHCAAAMSDVAFGCSPANQTLAADVTADPLEVVEGYYSVPTGPGLGIEVDESLVAALLN